MTQQALATLDERVSLPVVQILQLVDVVLALGLALLRVDVRQHTLNDGDLKNTRNTKFSSATFGDPHPAFKEKCAFDSPLSPGWPHPDALVECVSVSP